MENKQTKYDFPNISMSIIMPAGNARNEIEEAMNALLVFDYTGADAHLKEAKNYVKEAHKAQTEVMQQLAMDSFNGIDDTILPMLFIHAQDTIMTIMSEVTMFEQMYKLYQNLGKEIEKCKK